MHATTPGFLHASVERLCDYELPEPPFRAEPATTSAPLLSDAADAGNLALGWWLWMDEVGKSMWRTYDAWREQHFGQPAKGPSRRG